MGHYMEVPYRLHNIANALRPIYSKANPRYMGGRANSSPLANLIAKGNTYGLRPISGPLGKTCQESQYDSMASNSLSLPAPILMIKCLAHQAYMLLLESFESERALLMLPTFSCPLHQGNFLMIFINLMVFTSPTIDKPVKATTSFKVGPNSPQAAMNV